MSFVFFVFLFTEIQVHFFFPEINQLSQKVKYCFCVCQEHSIPLFANHMFKTQCRVHVELTVLTAGMTKT